MQPPPVQRPLLALLVRLGAIAALATMAALIKLVSARGVHVLEIMFWRQFVTLPLLFGWLLATGRLALLKTQRPGRHAMRAIYGTIGMVLTFGGFILLPLAEATVIGFTAPIWAVLLSMLLLKEKIGIWRWSAVLLGFAGILVITQPGGSTIPLFGATVALGSAFMIALISIQIADLNRTDRPETIVFYFAGFSAPVLALALPFVARSHDAAQWALLMGIGGFGLIGQLLLTVALRLGSIASVIVMDYSSLFWATLYGWLLFATLPSTSTWAGAPLVVVAGIIIVLREQHLARVGRREAARVEGT